MHDSPTRSNLDPSIPMKCDFFVCARRTIIARQYTRHAALHRFLSYPVCTLCSGPYDEPLTEKHSQPVFTLLPYTTRRRNELAFGISLSSKYGGMSLKAIFFPWPVQLTARDSLRVQAFDFDRLVAPGCRITGSFSGPPSASANLLFRFVAKYA